MKLKVTATHSISYKMLNKGRDVTDKFIYYYYYKSCPLREGVCVLVLFIR